MFCSHMAYECVIRFRCSEDKLSSIKDMAKSEGLSVSEYLRRCHEFFVSSKVKPSALTRMVEPHGSEDVVSADVTYRRFVEPGALLKNKR